MFSLGKVFAARSSLKLWLGACSILFTSLLASLNAQAQSIVNKNDASGSTGVTSFTITLPSVSSGNLINVGVGWCGGGTGCDGANAGSNTMTVTDSAGNTLTVPSGATLTGVSLATSIAQGIVTAASGGTDTFTIHFSSAVDYPAVSVSQISPPSGYTFSGADGNGTTASTTSTSLNLSLTTSNAEDLLYSFTWDESFNPGSGQTLINNSSGTGLEDSYILETSSGSYSMSYSLSGNSAPESGSMTAFKLSSSGGGGGEGPYGGTPWAIPGTVMAENYDTGGAGVGYYVTSVNGTDNSYRSDGVDLETATSPATGNDLGWTSSGQWFRYTVNVSTAGTYTVTFLVASPSGVTDGFHLANSSGTNLSGSVNVPETGGWQDWTTVTASVTLPAGTQTLTLDQDNSGWNIDDMVFSSSGSGEGPYGGSPASIPGTVMNENYDTGGAGVGYYVTSVNGTDNGYRSDGVDLETATSPATGNDLGWTSGGQWFRYTVDVYTAGTYTVSFLVASPSGVSDGFHLANSSGTNLTGSVNVPSTGGWQSWTTVTASVTLPGGTQTLTLDEDNSGWNIDDMVFSSGTGSVVPYGVSPPSGQSWVLTFDDEFTQDSSSIQMSYPPSGSITTGGNTWTWGENYGGTTCTSTTVPPNCSPNQWELLLNGAPNAAGDLLELIGGQLYLSDGPESFYVWEGGGSWASTSDPSLGVGPVNTSKWNGGAGGLTTWCDDQGGGTYIFAENPDNECGQYYDGLSLSSTKGLMMQSAGAPSAAIQTGGGSAGDTLFSQKYGYWEASFEVPSASDGDGGVANHSDFWMHAAPLATSWLPEFDIGERPTWNSTYAAANNVISFSIDDANGNSTGGYFSASGSPDLSAGFHKYGLLWSNDGSGPYGSMQIYLDGVPLLSSPWVLSSSNTNLANGIFIFLSVDNNGIGNAEPFNVQYVRVWQAQ
jgi:Carbohydrate binding module (family 6)/Glycosyl hydrolases family 16